MRISPSRVRVGQPDLGTGFNLDDVTTDDQVR
jgi:hypothetical protein